MQDKPHHTYTKAFVDTKWSDMTALLDAELPQPASDSKNILIVWLLSILLFIAIAVAGYYAYLYKHLIPNAELTKEKIIYKSIYIDQDKNVEVKFNAVPSTKGVNKNKSQSPASVLQKSKETTDFSFTESKQSLSRPNIEETLVSNNKLTDLENIANKNSRPVSSLPEVTLEKNQNFDLNKERGVKVNAALTAIMTNDSEFTGYGISSSMDIPLSNKLGFNAGLAINFMSKDHYFVKGIPRAEQTENLPQAPVNPNQTIVYAEELRSLKQVSLPLGLNYSLSEALSLNSGVRLRYTYSTELENEPRPSKRYQEEAESFLNKANVGFSAGLKYSLNGHFSILLDSEWGMGSLARTAQFSDPSRPNHDLNLVNLTTNYTF